MPGKHRFLLLLLAISFCQYKLERTKSKRRKKNAPFFASYIPASHLEDGPKGVMSKCSSELSQGIIMDRAKL